MKKHYLIWGFAVAILSFTACVDKDITPPTPGITSGSADFSRYIAVGNSITSGYADGGLYLAGQQMAFPNLLAGQMKLAGGGAFTSPLFPTDQANGSGYLKLTGYNPDGTPIITQVPPQAVRGQVAANGIPSLTVTLYTKYSGDLNNYGVPGIRLFDVTNQAYGNYNGYYERLLPENVGSSFRSYLDFVTTKPFTFFTCWLGNNDVLGYATSNGTSYTDPLTSPTSFSQLYTTTVAALTKKGAKGVVTTIPDVTVIPYFHYITVPALVAAAQKVNPAFTNIYIQALNTSGSYDTYVTRAATNDDDIMLSFDTKQLGATVNGKPLYGLSPTNPLSSAAVLDVNEIARVQDYVASYNTSIKAVAATYNLPVFDAYTLLNGLKNGVTQNGVNLNTNFISGGFFSLDGIHFTPRGNAYVTDEMIKVINAKYGSNMPALDISAYNTIKTN
ncbi:MAG: G-D-S-L family lipolytic protein [Sphingobacteriaceae bacterium]|nr:MAG: G-D-S-L family lipolytic protein [Sphingobacteriaceae bacterium]